MPCFSQHHMLQPHHSILQGLPTAIQCTFLGFATLNSQQKTSSTTYSSFSLTDTFNSLALHRPSLYMTAASCPQEKLLPHPSAFVSHILPYYLLSRDLLMRCPKTLRAQQHLWLAMVQPSMEYLEKDLFSHLVSQPNSSSPRLQ